MLRVSVTEAYEAKCKEKEEDLVVLRREMLEAVTKFSSDKQYWEKILDQKEDELQDEKVRCLE
jgi:hypothetical protein